MQVTDSMTHCLCVCFFFRNVATASFWRGITCLQAQNVSVQFLSAFSSSHSLPQQKTTGQSDQQGELGGHI